MGEYVRFSELKQKEVIHICQGLRMGYPRDLVLDLASCQAAALIVPGPCRFWGLFGSREDYVIPWSCIRTVGDDLILVDGSSQAWKEPRKKRPLFGQ